MGLRSLINFDDNLKESLDPPERVICLSYIYPTILDIYNDFKYIIVTMEIL